MLGSGGQSLRQLQLTARLTLGHRDRVLASNRSVGVLQGPQGCRSGSEATAVQKRALCSSGMVGTQRGTIFSDGTEKSNDAQPAPLPPPPCGAQGAARGAELGMHGGCGRSQTAMSGHWSLWDSETFDTQLTGLAESIHCKPVPPVVPGAPPRCRHELPSLSVGGAAYTWAGLQQHTRASLDGHHRAAALAVLLGLVLAHPRQPLELLQHGGAH